MQREGHPVGHTIFLIIKCGVVSDWLVTISKCMVQPACVAHHVQHLNRIRSRLGACVSGDFHVTLFDYNLSAAMIQLYIIAVLLAALQLVRHLPGI